MFAGTIDFTVMVPLVGVLATLTTLAVFDLYAFSPRPSGIAKRSRELAPMLAIGLSMVLAAASLHLQTTFELNALIANGAGDAMHTLQGERLRLLTYPLVVTNPFESLLLGFALLASAFFLVSSTGLLGWSLIVLSITILTGVTAAIANASGICFGPFELIVGLGFASAYAFSREPLESRRRWSELGLLACLFLTAAISGVLSKSPLRLDLLVAASVLAVATTAILLQLAQVAGPHWEATSLFFISGIAVFVVAGFSLALAPQFFDREQWQNEVVVSREAIHDDLAKILAPLENGAAPAPETELGFAERLASGATRLRYLASRAEAASNLEPSESQRLHEIKTLEKMLRVLEQLHRSRALVADTERRTSAVPAADAIRNDPMRDYWRKHRPWMQAELRQLKSELSQADSMRAFVSSMEVDLDRLTRAAVEIEVHRVDVWVDWAARQPRDLVPKIKLTAIAELARLDALILATEPAARKPDPKYNSLHRSLRKMASVSEDKWE